MMRYVYENHPAPRVKRRCRRRKERVSRDYYVLPFDANTTENDFESASTAVDGNRVLRTYRARKFTFERFCERPKR